VVARGIEAGMGLIIGSEGGHISTRLRLIQRRGDHRLHPLIV
jgi:hypothetical protein